MDGGPVPTLTPHAIPSIYQGNTDLSAVLQCIGKIAVQIFSFLNANSSAIVIDLMFLQSLLSRKWCLLYILNQRHKGLQCNNCLVFVDQLSYNSSA